MQAFSASAGLDPGFFNARRIKSVKAVGGTTKSSAQSTTDGP